MTPLSIITALSLQRNPTTNHPTAPTQDRIISQIISSGTPAARIVIAVRMMTLDTHLMYQSRVPLGVADLKIRFEFANSLGSNLLSVIVEIR